MKSGGSVSHHHGNLLYNYCTFQGIGKIRKMFMKRSIGGPGQQILKDLKKNLDPNGIFKNGNLGI
jgi:FAD/FMN-containing dehydrogenase